MDPGLARDALTLGVGLMTGVLSAAFGVGGAVLSTPGIRLLGASAADAVGSTLAPGIAYGTASRFACAAVGSAAGALSGLLGIGGGVVMVPGFTEVLGMPIKRAIASSLVCVGVFAVPGTITHAALGDIDWRFALLL